MTVPFGTSRSRVQQIDRLKSSYLPNEHTIHRVDHCASAAGVSSRLGSSGGHAGHVLARAVRTRKPGNKTAATLSETSTRRNLERVVRVIDPAASSNHLGGSPAPMNLHLLSGAARRTMCSAAGRAAAAICRRARRASAGSRRSARHAAALAAPQSAGGCGHLERRRRAAEAVLGRRVASEANACETGG